MKKLLFFTLTFIVLVFPVLIGLSYWGSISYFGDSYKNLSPWGWPVTDTGYFSQEIYGQKYPISRKFLYKVENPNASHYLLLLGGSNTFGQGMQSNLPADIIANGLGDTNVYSLAYPGWAINNIFPLFESFDYQNEIKGEEGLVVYQFHDFHLERICGAARIFHWNDGSSPYFYLNDGQLVREGYFRDHFWEYEAKFPFLGLYRLMIWAGLGRNFGFLTLYNSFQVDSCLDVTIGLLKNVESKSKNIFPSAKFGVLFLPRYNWVFERAKKAFQKSGITLFDPSGFVSKNIEMRYSREKLYQKDGHFKGFWYENLVPFYREILDKTLN